ncbi:MAG: HIT domain-containing protein [Campylobacterales bacterium]|nr:HIT domain-containing protein [Campylobacterales bacterium]
MENLYAPWRTDYITGEKIEGCVFCHISKNKELDKKHHVLYRDEICFVVMNKYPYTPGHFMIIPHEHTDSLENLNSEYWLHISTLAQKGVRLLKEGFKSQGVNLGMNLGVCGGAGIAEHIHLHLVPRFPRDTNFITAIGDSRVYSTDFERIYKEILELSKDYF